MNLYLICHGMMAFWYRPQVPDGYRILIPQCPLGTSGNQEHQLRLGTSIGAPMSNLAYPAQPMGTKIYQLTFGSSPQGSAKARGMKSAASNLALYAQKPNVGGAHLIPNYGTDGSAGVAFAIDIPYPDDEQPARVETYQADPYCDCSTVRAFNIHPRSLPRSNVYKFNIANANLSIQVVNENDPSDVLIPPIRPVADVKLYLYSGPATMADMTGKHLDSFNKMFSFGAQTSLDLALNPASGVSCTPVRNTTPPFNLSQPDTLHLAEINSGMDFCNAPVPIGATLMATDPAECVQGPGC